MPILCYEMRWLIEERKKNGDGQPNILTRFSNEAYDKNTTPDLKTDVAYIKNLRNKIFSGNFSELM
jgi:hypothetical protein